MAIVGSGREFQSDNGRVVRLATAAEPSPERAARIAEIKEQIARGEYVVDTDALARKLLASGEVSSF